MILPRLDQPARYRGLYVFDFGEWSAVGYTAEEIALLLESERFRDGKVYRIHRALPDGTMELSGVSAARFQMESGLFFNRDDLSAARTDFHDLIAAARATPPPCRAKLHLSRRRAPAPSGAFVTVMIYPAEYEDDVAEWLLNVGFAGGDTVEGGPSQVTHYYHDSDAVLAREQLWSRESNAPRSREELYASIRRVAQR